MPLTFEALSSGISDGESILFKAILTDKAGNATTGHKVGQALILINRFLHFLL